MPNEKTENDYLWDGSGQLDPEIQKLENLLGTFRSTRPAPVFPAVAPAARWSFLPTWLTLRPALAALIVICTLAIGIVLLRIPGKVLPVSNAPGWQISEAKGNAQAGRLSVGQALETDNHSTATLTADSVGQIKVEPDTRLRLVSMSNGIKRLALDRGTIHAYIWSSPGEFIVDTPAAVTVDLGCAYTLHVDDSGAGTVRTSLGWVGFKLEGRESFIPAGAACATKPRVGPGTPYQEDSSAKFREALTRFDFSDPTEQQRTADLAIILAESRKEDALTLWHLLSRAEIDQRSRVYDRLAHFVPPPAPATREAVLRLDQSALDSWWNQLGYDDIAIWRQFERTWPDKK